MISCSLQSTIMYAKEDIATYCRLLLEAGADPNALDHFGFTPMTSLIKRGFRDGSDVNEKHMMVRTTTAHACDVLHVNARHFTSDRAPADAARS